MILNAQGEPEEGKKCLELAIRLNPHHPNWYLCYLGASYFLLGDYEKAISLMEPTPEALPEVRAFLMAAHIHAGQFAEAKRHAEEFLRTYSLHWRGTPSARSIATLLSFKREEDVERMLSGMHKAGIPE
jgi:tetratricopeptide (TPR) repeat protein